MPAGYWTAYAGFFATFSMIGRRIVTVRMGSGSIPGRRLSHIAQTLFRFPVPAAGLFRDRYAGQHTICEGRYEHPDLIEADSALSSSSLPDEDYLLKQHTHEEKSGDHFRLHALLSQDRG